MRSKKDCSKTLQVNFVTCWKSLQVNFVTCWKSLQLNFVVCGKRLQIKWEWNVYYSCLVLCNLHWSLWIFIDHRHPIGSSQTLHRHPIGTPQAPYRHPQVPHRHPTVNWMNRKGINGWDFVEKRLAVIRRRRVNMPYQNRRNCPICCKSGLLSLSHHLAQVHQLSSEERKPWLKSAIFSSAKSTWITLHGSLPLLGNATSSLEPHPSTITTR